MREKRVKVFGILLLIVIFLCGCNGKQEAGESVITATPTPHQSQNSEPQGGKAEILDELKQTAQDFLSNANAAETEAVKSLGNTKRMKAVLERMANGEEVKVAFLGGSITEGYLVQKKECYAFRTVDWLRTVFQNPSIQYIDAGLSGTSSTIGLLRVEKDVLEKQPDIVVVEFAVNDANDSVSKMMFESLVKKIMNSESEPAVVLLFTRLENGYSCEEHMTAVGEAFCLPMVSVNTAIGTALQDGSLQWSDYAKDEAHPTKEGHETIARRLEVMFSQTILAENQNEEVDDTQAKAFGSPYEKMHLYNTENLYLTELGGFEESNSNVAAFPNNWLWSKKDYGPLRFTMKGKDLVLLFKENNNEKTMGKVDVYVDGKKKKTVNSYSKSGWNNPQTVIVLNEAAEGEHEVEIRICEDSIEKNFHLLGIGTTGTIFGEERISMDDMTYQERAIVNVGNTYKISKVLEKAAAKEPVTIGFIGGSITQGSGASRYENCYAKRVHAWWCETFPETEITFVNAGIGATTSQFAVARVKEDLLAYKPDFVIVEFSVNDSNTAFFGETYESLVRRILTDECEPAVMILNMVQYNDGVNAQMIHNDIAKKYQIPAVSMKESIYREIVLKRLSATDLSADMLHPNDTGHAYGAEIVTYFLTRVMNGEYSHKEEAKIPEPVYSLNSIHSTRYDSTNASPELHGFVRDDAVKTAVSDVFKHGYKAKNAGDSIVFSEIYGNTICVQYKKTNTMGAPKGIAIIDGDEENAVVLDGNFENGWGDWLYLETLCTTLDANVAHTVEIRLTESAAKDFYLVSVISTGKGE